MYDYVDYGWMGRILDSWDIGAEISEPHRQDSCLVGDAWIKMIIGKHGNGAHSQNTLVAYATKMAAYDAGINSLGGHIIERDMPMYLQTYKVQLNNFEKYEAKEFRTQPVETVTFYRST